MKALLTSRPFAAAVLVLAALSGSATAALITSEENFNSTPVSTVPSGWQAVSSGGTTTAAVGVNGTNGWGAGGSQGSGFQTTGTFDLTTGTTYDFNASFYYTTSNSTTNNGLFGIGFTDVTSSPNNSGGADRMMVAVAAAGTAGTYALATGGQFNTMDATRRVGSTFSLTSNSWYTLSGSVSYTDGTSTFNFTNLSLVNIGATGTTAAGPNLFGTTSVSTAVSGGNGDTLSDTAAKFGVYTSGGGRGSIVFDNVNAVPEPSTWLLLTGGLTCALVMRRRR